ncbi:MAG: tetratricopeptide repeat protein, partial [Candidatus Riflebacteria bacterium]|nr:tetratricopeptide repeat protein [Candidatus Riflebacteria bacterium]
ATENRRWTRAKDAFKQALDTSDRDADTLLKYFKSCYYIGEGADAILFLEQIRSKYPNERRIQLTVAEANFQLGDLPAAKAICEEMLAKDPGDSRVNDLLQRVNRLHK